MRKEIGTIWKEKLEDYEWISSEARREHKKGTAREGITLAAREEWKVKKLIERGWGILETCQKWREIENGVRRLIMLVYMGKERRRNLIIMNR